MNSTVTKPLCGWAAFLAWVLAFGLAGCASGERKDVGDTKPPEAGVGESSGEKDAAGPTVELRLVNVYGLPGSAHSTIDAYSHGRQYQLVDVAKSLGYAEATGYITLPLNEFGGTVDLVVVRPGAEPDERGKFSDDDEIGVFTNSLDEGERMTMVVFDSFGGDPEAISSTTIQESDKRLVPPPGKSLVRPVTNSLGAVLERVVWTLGLAGGACFEYDLARNDQPIPVDPGNFKVGIYDLNEGKDCTGPAYGVIDIQLVSGVGTILVVHGEKRDELGILALQMKK